MRKSKLASPPYLEVVGRASYYWVHSGHAEHAINIAIRSISDAEKRDLDEDLDEFEKEMTTTVGEWAKEALIQGAFLKYYHMWEVDTKTYFNGQYSRPGKPEPNWKRPGSHVEKVAQELRNFDADVDTKILEAIDRARTTVNQIKHDGDIIIDHAEYESLVRAVLNFWEVLAEQEQFTMR